jgi:hypothetical protein
MLELLKVTIFSKNLGLSKKCDPLTRRTATFVDYKKNKKYCLVISLKNLFMTRPVIKKNKQNKAYFL